MKELVMELRLRAVGVGDALPETADLMNQAADALERYQWVSVNERLPENRQEVLGHSVSFGQVELVRWNDDMDRWDVPWTTETATRCAFNAWIPLPPPPSGENG